jgi:hypothetical protein
MNNFFSMDEPDLCDTCPYHRTRNVGTKADPIYTKTCTFKAKSYEKGRHCYYDVYSDDVQEWVDRREVRGVI